MPQPPTANMALVTPTPTSDIGIWGDELNAALLLIDSHDHSTGKGVKITPTGLNITADLPFATNSITGARSLDLTPVANATMTSRTRAIFWSSDTGELSVRNASGTVIQITSGGTLNISIVGGIVGDYAAVGAEVAYDDANDRYTFKQQLSAGVKQWARHSGADVDLYEYRAAGDATNIINRVRLKSPAALAASYAVTWPGAVPVSAAAVQMDAAGQLAVSNVFLTMPSFTNSVSLQIPSSMVIDQAAAHGPRTADRITIAASASPLVFPVSLPYGSRITGYAVFVRKTTGAGDTIAARLTATDGSTGALTSLGTGVTSNANNPGYTALSESLAVDLASPSQYYVMFTPGGATAANHSLLHLRIDYFRP